VGQTTSNERLRNAIAAARLSVADVARSMQVDAKTVQRWIKTGRTPYRRHRRGVAALLKLEEAYLWPSILNDAGGGRVHAGDFVALYPNRGAVPGDLWLALVNQARESIDILVYAGLFLWDAHPELPDRLGSKAIQGVRIRLTLGDPQSEAVRLRGQEEGIGDALAARIRMSLAYLREAASTPGVELRLHSTVLYNSLYRFDEDLLVNIHAYGSPAARSPVLQIRQRPGGTLFNHYLASFDRVWSQARLHSLLIGEA
jgi:hypothetical protein